MAATLQQQQQPPQAQQRGRPRVFAFVFPMASGHVNPSLPVARVLVQAGHQVHYLVREQMREAVEDTGASFHDELEVAHELYRGRAADMHGAIEALREEFGAEGECFMHSMAMLRGVELELLLPGYLRWLRELKANAVVYCPIMTPGGAIAASVLGMPSIALLTFAGPGSLPVACMEVIKMNSTTPGRMVEIAETYQPNLDAIERMNKQYGLQLTPAGTFFFKPIGKLGVLKYSAVTLVTTCEDLQDPLTHDMAEDYRREGVRIAPVGPLLDVAGAKRVGGHKTSCQSSEHSEAADDLDDEALVSKVHAAKANGRKVVLVSMGTVVTGDCKDLGWEGRCVGEDGRPRGLRGREICQAAWAGAFDAFGAEHAEEGPLLVVAVGPQPDPLGEVKAPANAVCVPAIPQVDILKAGVDVFLNHGGQNSFTEGLSVSTPLVVCPWYCDQPVNARRAEALGVGLAVMRPDPDEGHEAAAAAKYRADVALSLKRVMSEPHFTEAAARCAERLLAAGGVPRAVEWMLAVAGAGDLEDPSEFKGKVHTKEAELASCTPEKTGATVSMAGA